MNKKNLFFAALFFAALAFGFVGCENPDDESGTLMENPDDESGTLMENPDDNIDNDVEYRLEAFSNNTMMGTVVGSGTYKKGTEVSITAKPNDFYHLCTWSDCDTKDLVRKVVVNSDTTITAIFSDNPYLSVKSNNIYGTVSGSGTYEIGSEATITATPKENCYFTGWSDCDSKELTRTVVVNTDSTIIANFAKKPKLVAKPNDVSYGTVTGSGYYDVGTKVTITAATKGGHCYFNGWSDCNSKELTREVVITSDTTIIANFTADLYLNVWSNNTSFGTVTGSGYYAVGSEATITATPKENCYFTGWSDSDSKELTRTVQVNSNKTITANFAKKPYLTAKPNNSDYGTVTGSGYYDVGSEATITATPNNYDYIEFVQWNDGNTENPRTITVTSNVTYTATFKAPDGAFLVNSDGKCVYFSSGNLQYHPANNEWRFAPSQLDYIGASNSNCSSTYNGWLDLFGWSTSATNFGVSTSTSSGDYSGTFVDWGSNQIGADAPNTWRTLTYDEWRYLRYNRTNADDLCGVAQVNGVNGLVFLPDSWTCPAGVTFKSGFHSSSGSSYYAAYQTFTANQWSKMEQQGAVFLPAAGYRGSNVYSVQYYGYYWSATERGSNYAFSLYFYSDEAYVDFHGRYCGHSVRLVKDL